MIRRKYHVQLIDQCYIITTNDKKVPLRHEQVNRS